MKKIILATGLIILTLSVIWVIKSYRPKYKTITINQHRIRAEIAETEQAKNKGLSQRQSLAEDAGMLFVFSVPDRYNFWMKDVNFPLDFIWIKDDQIVDLTKDVPPPYDSSDLKTYTSTQPADKVLEVNAGTIDKLGIKTNDGVEFSD